MGVSSELSSILSRTDIVGSKSPLEIMVKDRLQIINSDAMKPVALVRKSPADLENIKLSCETPIPKAPPSDFWIKIRITRIVAKITFTVRKISNGVGVERIFPLSSPFLEEIKVLKKGKVRRARLFYLREKSGKAARIKEDYRNKKEDAAKAKAEKATAKA